MHTALYHKVMLQTVPQPCERALDVGCGPGEFSRSLAGIAAHVDAIDRDPAMIARARLASSDVPNLDFICADFMSDDSGLSGGYDFICALASLHHLPFAAALARIKALLRAGGVFGAIGLYRCRGPLDLLMSLIAFPVSRVLRLHYRRSNHSMPLRDPDLTLAEIRQQVEAVLPGATVRRRLFWRYTLVYTAPPPI